MIKCLLCFVVLLLISVAGFGQELKCKTFKTGTFIIPGDSIVSRSTLKRSKTSQTERISAKEFTNLDIKWLDDCNYVLTLSTPTPEHTLSEVEKLIEKDGGLRIGMLRTAADTLFFRATAKINGTEHSRDGYQMKVSKDY
ncbi:hypothetical protein ES692_02360 [Psychroserpens burtonensis]|uniref:Uncharacterized protein n=1 Tax=Psychroserpens burtonensis TaxID=49278 RepID=A0A5C7BJU0_9FLAO|nr:hypothetical protein [Psychroserpens burtonensis]TXE19616.1 hypothetical protein ES692_02360 [Psychroserpens burtonensis]